MTTNQALYTFWNSFDIPAYPTSSVPDQNERPKAYLTYEEASGFFDSDPIATVVNVWYRTTSETKPTQKADEIGKRIGKGGMMIRCDNGTIWIKRGNPWCLSIVDEDPDIKRRYLNLWYEFIRQEQNYEIYKNP